MLAVLLVLSLPACNKTVSNNAPTDNVVPANNAAPIDNGTAVAQDPIKENPYANWPEDTVHLYLPVSAGGNVDNYSRIISEWFEKATGQALVIENLNTGGGTLCYETIRQSPADGYHLMMYNSAFFASHYTGSYDYAPLDIVEPLATMQILPATALAVPANSPYQTFRDLIEASKAAPDTITVGVSAGSTGDLAVQHINIASGAKLKIVDAGNDGDRLTALLGGSIDCASLKAPSAHKYVQSGELRILALTDDGNGFFKDIYPSVCNLGYPDVIYGSTNFIFAPKGIDPDLAERINEVFQGIYSDEVAIQKSNDLGAPFRITNLAGAVEECTKVDATIKSVADKLGLTYTK